MHCIGIFYLKMDQNMHFDPFLGKVLTEPSELTPQEQSYDF